jgi:DNA-binding LytR/AlgR family response regulator
MNFLSNKSDFEQLALKLLADNRKFALQTITGFLILKRSEVVYFQYNSSSHVWQIFLTENRTAKLRLSITAKEILNICSSFCQINHNVIVNIDYLASIDKNFSCTLYPPYNHLEIAFSRLFFSKLKETLEII